MAYRGQSTIEMVVIFGGIMLVIAIIASVLPGESAAVQGVRMHAIADNTVQLVASTANDVYLAGDGAQRTIWVELPDSYIASSSFIGSRTAGADWGANKTVDLYLNPGGDVFALSRAPLCGSWPTAAGRYQVVVAYNSTPPAHVTVNASC